MHRRTGIRRWVVLALLSVLLGESHPASSQAASASLPPNKDQYLTIAAEAEATLHRDVLDVWFPRNVDNQNGGFYSGFDRKWQPTTSEGKFSVFQARMTWISSQIVLQRPEMKTSSC